MNFMGLYDSEIAIERAKSDGQDEAAPSWPWYKGDEVRRTRREK